MELALQQEKAKQLRADIVKMTYLAKSGHPGGSLSCVEMLMALYYNIMKVDPSNPGWEERDRFCLLYTSRFQKTDSCILPRL